MTAGLLNAPLRMRAAQKERIGPLPVDLLLVAGVTLLGAALRFSTLRTQSLWFDEALTLGAVKSSFGGMLSQIPHTDALPPLYFVIEWPWSRVFGDSEFAIRSLSALAGTAMIPVAYAAGRTLVGRGVGLAVAVLAAVSPPLLWYSQEARPYALFALLCSLSLWFFARARARPSRREFAAWGVASALALATHYFALCVVVPEALLLLADRRLRRGALVATAGIAVAGAALLPLALYERSHAGPAWIATTSFSGRLRALPYFFINNSDHGRATKALLIALLVGIIVSAAVALRRRALRLSGGAWAALIIGVAALAIPLIGKTVGSDYFLNRNLLPAWLPLAIFFAAALSARAARPYALVLLAALAAVSLDDDIRTFTTPALQRDDWRGVARALGGARTTRLIVISPSWQWNALQPYRPRIRASNPKSPLVRPVREIDTVFFHGPVPFGAPVRTVVPPSPFRPLKTTQVQRRFTVVRYVAPRPTRLALGALYQPPPNGAWPFVDTGVR